MTTKTWRRGKKTSLTDDQIKEIKYLLSINTPYNDIAGAYNVNTGTLSNIKHGKIFKDV